MLFHDIIVIVIPHSISLYFLCFAPPGSRSALRLSQSFYILMKLGYRERASPFCENFRKISYLLG